MQKNNNTNVEGRFEGMEMEALLDVQGGEIEGVFYSVRNAIVELFNLNKKDEKN